MVNEPLSINLTIPSPLERFQLKQSSLPDLTIDIKRDDLIHPMLSGNKIRKLLGHRLHSMPDSYVGLMSMGGPWSNHLHACSWLCRELAIPFTAIIRGQAPNNYTDTLDDMVAWGAKLEFVSRAEFREIREYYENTRLDFPAILSAFNHHYFIPEGGRHKQSLVGVEQLAGELSHDYDAVYIAVGTGTTLACLLRYWSNPKTRFYGVLAVDAVNSQLLTIKELAAENSNNYTLLKDFTVGGFARVNEQLLAFISNVYNETQIALEPIYTAKAMYALQQHINEGRYDEQAKILFIHTGGLQGLRGYKQSDLAPLRAEYQNRKLEI